MSFKSFLSEVGNDFKAVFGWLGSAKGQSTIATVEGAATAVVGSINPAAGAILNGIEGLVNNALKQVVSAETVAAAAASQSGTGAQKAAAAISAVSPQVSSILQSLGVKEPSADQVQSIAQVVATSLANIVNAFPASAATS
jgi:hypothetical protein